MITIYTSNHQQHDTRGLIVNGQPFIVEELPQRAEFIKTAVEMAKLGPILEPEDFGLQPILELHDPDYVDFLRTIYEKGRAFYGDDRPLLPETYSTRRPFRKTNHPIGQMGYYCFASYTPILSGTWNAAYWSAQCALTAAHLARVKNQTTYAICRPPGHHASRDYYGGFCYLNNAALAAKTLPGKTAILDIDFHHGNGTQEIFYNNPSVLYMSIHADPDQEYPFFWGSADERGERAGEGKTINYPLPLGASDEIYLETLDHCLSRLLDFAPDYLVVSVGFDILAGDPAGGFNITNQGLQQIGKRIASLTRQGLPTILIQEGGYLLQTLGMNAITFLKEFNS
jgi:acetoin utilization deacetylase AcuC-like enzyme